MRNTTYILGAGASCNALPLLATMNKRMLLLLSILKNDPKDSNYNGILKIKGTERLYEKYKDVVQKAITHHTPDTYAKKLWLTKKWTELDLLKEFLQLYFCFEQDSSKSAYEQYPLDFDSSPRVYPLGDETHEYKRGPLSVEETILWEAIGKTEDERYDVFLASLLQNEKGLCLPDNLNVLTWNYDNQFELAYSNYSPYGTIEEKIHQAESELNILSRRNISNRGVRMSHIIKLNGGSQLLFDPIPNKPSLLTFKDTIDWYLQGTTEFSKNIYYAWELENREQDNRLEKAKEIISKTEKFVIIGYSFPNFNREVDKFLFEDFNETLRTEIYIQVPSPEEFIRLESRLRNILPEESTQIIQHIPDKDQFFIPF